MPRWTPTNHQIAKAEGMVWLQGAGFAPAKPAIELKPGDVMLFNYYGTGHITAIEPNAKGTSVHITVVADDGKTYTMRKQAGTLVGVKP